MRSVEAEGASIDEAITRALRALGAERDQVEVEILENARRGVLGIGRKAARVRATIRAPLNWLEAVPLGRDEPSGSADAERSADRGRETRPARGARGRDTGGAASKPAVATTFDADRVLGDIVRLMGLGVEVRAGGDDARTLEITGDGAADLIGRHGEVLDALEYVVNRIAERAAPDAGRYTLDVAGYRERRRTSLVELAERAAEKARRKGKPVTLSPMSPADRRTVQAALQTTRGISTRTVGQGFHRKLMVIPEEARRRGGKPAAR